MHISDLVYDIHIHLINSWSISKSLKVQSWKVSWDEAWRMAFKLIFLFSAFLAVKGQEAVLKAPNETVNEIGEKYHGFQASLLMLSLFSSCATIVEH